MEKLPHIIVFIRMLPLLACLFGIALPLTPAYGGEPVRIGVLAYRPKLQTLAQWQPLAAALKQAMPERDFVVEAFTFPELDTAVAGQQLDFVLTNPGHYVLLSKRSGLSAPLATVAVNDNGRPTAVFGGVIFSRAGQANINTLSDIKGKTIAATSTDSFGGYQMEAYELKQAGVRLPQDAKLVVTGMPHDNVVEAVLAGRADGGFVRSGVLEGMAREGRLDMAQLNFKSSESARFSGANFHPALSGVAVCLSSSRRRRSRQTCYRGPFPARTQYCRYAGDEYLRLCGTRRLHAGSRLA